MSTDLDPKTFDVLSFVAQQAYPTEEVVVYTDTETAYKLAKVVKERKAAEKAKEVDPEAETPPGPTVGYEDELREKLAASALTFKLRGKSPKALKELADRLTPEDYESKTAEEKAKIDEDHQVTLIAECTVAVKNAQGDVDAQWDANKVIALRDYLNAGEFMKLVEAIVQVNFNVKVFDDAVDAGFPLGRSESAA